MAQKCELHGLMFDPTTQSGCVICRREQAGGGGGRGSTDTGSSSSSSSSTSSGGGVPWRGILAVLALISAGLSLYNFYLKNKRSSYGTVMPPNAQVGAPCSGQENACVAGADCLTGGLIPDINGTCVKRCASDAECSGAAGESCHQVPGILKNYCVHALHVNEPCGGGGVCEEGTDCMFAAGMGSRCLQICSVGGAECPAGTMCNIQVGHCVSFP